ncbi:hypothetical protein DFJ73DRAFT_798460 [Zopfochytrium polystomum]|nr:hypothetical protein DFJ73DRAFT_798460 [Zopfochytrium polystomum]
MADANDAAAPADSGRLADGNSSSSSSNPAQQEQQLPQQPPPVLPTPSAPVVSVKHTLVLSILQDRVRLDYAVPALPSARSAAASPKDIAAADAAAADAVAAAAADPQLVAVDLNAGADLPGESDQIAPDGAPLSLPVEWDPLAAILLFESDKYDPEGIISDFELPALGSAKTITDGVVGDDDDAPPVLLAGISCICQSTPRDDGSSLKRAIVVLSNEQLPELARMKIRIVARSYVEQEDGSSFDLIRGLHASLNKNIRALFDADDTYDDGDWDDDDNFTLGRITTQIQRSVAPLQQTVGRALQTAESSIVSAVHTLTDAEQHRAIQANISQALVTAENSIGRALDSAEVVVNQAYHSAEASISKAVSTLTDPEQHRKIQESASQMFSSVSSWFASTTSSLLGPAAAAGAGPTAAAAASSATQEPSPEGAAVEGAADGVATLHIGESEDASTLSSTAAGGQRTAPGSGADYGGL